MLQALRERLSLTAVAYKEGDLVFAQSADGYRYPAKILSIDGLTITVAFLNGGQTALAHTDIQMFKALPGQILNCPWPDYGWWNCRLISYDSQTQIVFMTDGWGSEQWFRLQQVRIKPEGGELQARARQIWIYAGIALGSGIVGALLMRMFFLSTS